ncbi:MAG: hypothetical protein ACOVMM_05745 [Chitinophagaceae bacterium]
MKNNLKITCKEASFLISKKQEVSISIIDRLKLLFHLFYCKVCARFLKQTNAIIKVLHTTPSQKSNQTLSSTKKEHIKKTLSTAINGE